MDFDFKKARKNKQRQDKVRSTHQHHSNQKSKNPDQRNSSHSSNEKGHATPLKMLESPSLHTPVEPTQFEHLKKESEDVAALSETKSYSRRVIVSNWERYELPPDILEDQADEALDFETLIKSLSDLKGRLKLRHEQNWGNERSELQEDFFNIDMCKLTASLERVPYHARQNLPASLFTPEQLAVFEEDAEEARKQSCLFTTSERKQPVISSPVSSATEIGDNKLPAGVSCIPAVVLETTDSSENQSAQKPFSQSVLEAKSSSASENFSQTTNILKETSPTTGCLKSDELDLDLLLSLDAAIPDKPKLPQQINIQTTTVAAPSKVSETGKLDDWLDDFLYD